MKELILEPRFERAYRKLHAPLKAKVDDAIEAIIADDIPQGLRVKKMRKFNDVYEASPTKAIRLTFQKKDGDYIFRNVGEHDEVLIRNP